MATLIAQLQNPDSSESVKEESSAPVSENISENEDSNSAKYVLNEVKKESPPKESEMETDVKAPEEEEKAIVTDQVSSSTHDQSQDETTESKNFINILPISQEINSSHSPNYAIDITKNSTIESETMIPMEVQETNRVTSCLDDQKIETVSMTCNPPEPCLSQNFISDKNEEFISNTQMQLPLTSTSESLSSHPSSISVNVMIDSDLSIISDVLNNVIDKVCSDSHRTFPPGISPDIIELCDDLVDQVCASIDGSSYRLQSSFFKPPTFQSRQDSGLSFWPNQISNDRNELSNNELSSVLQSK